MTADDRKGSGDGGGVSLKTRLYAWWEGYDLSALKRRQGDDGRDHAGQAPPASGKAAAAGMNRWGKPLWSATRIEVAERLWGTGFTTPGGNDHVPYLVKPLGLNPAMSVLDLSAGLGGTSRAMASKYGCWVTGLESTALLAKEGMERSFREGLEKKAVIEAYDPEHFSYSKRVDAILYKEGLFSVQDKEQLFDGMEMALKPRGHLLLTDYILAGDTKRDVIEGWADKEPLEPNLWSLERMQNAFAQRNLDLRIAEDMTDTHRHLILVALQAFAGYLEQYALTHETKVAVMDEIELWVRRVAALDAGLRCYRFYAIKPAE
ncbi:methyltransferase domain-containing protein [Azospirillum halopraeferens]|uniref:methyltransferase domain-containing protein n=1 Tax=Azospirillum halopraeferens TaxID=34010 RepID=UPI00040199F5|nr:methyltransferase domain-containing protein [Azospirillum halopraeferens]